MEFFATNGKRPVRLSEKTRVFAYESLNHKYGLDAKQTPCVFMDDVPEFEDLTDLEKYDAAMERIAVTAPIRICDGEKVSGAATLGDGMHHVVPAKFQGKHLFSSVSHLTVDFETVLKKGINFIRTQAEEALDKYTGTEKEPFAQS